MRSLFAKVDVPLATHEGEIMKQALVAALLATGAVFATLPDAAAQQAATVKSAPQPNAKYRVVFQVSDKQGWSYIRP